MVAWSQPESENERQQRVNDFVGCISCNPKAVLRHLSIMEVLAALRDNIVCVDTATPPNGRQQSLNRASTEHQQSFNRASTECQQSISPGLIQCQQSVNDFGCCILYNPRALLRQISRIILLVAILSKSDRHMVTAQLGKLASTERQRLCVLHIL